MGWEDTGQWFGLSKPQARLEAGLFWASFPEGLIPVLTEPPNSFASKLREGSEDVSFLKKCAVWEHVPSSPSDSAR